MQELFERLLDAGPLSDLNQPIALLYVVVVLCLLLLGRLLYSASVSYRLNDELGKHDNPAVGVAFAGYMIGLGTILWSVLTAGGLHNLGMDLADLAITGMVGAVLLLASQRLIDRLSFPSFSIPKGIAEHNLAASLVTAGGYIGTGLILASALEVEGHSLPIRMLDGGIFFVASQLAFLGFTAVYQKATHFDLHVEVEKGNPAVGLSYGLSLIAVSQLLAYAISQTASLVVLAAWFVGSSVVMHILRVAIDRLLLPGHDLDQELARDRNWGVALLEGSLTVVVARIVTGAF